MVCGVRARGRAEREAPAGTRKCRATHGPPDLPEREEVPASHEQVTEAVAVGLPLRHARSAEADPALLTDDVKLREQEEQEADGDEEAAPWPRDDAVHRVRGRGRSLGYQQRREEQTDDHLGRLAQL